MGLESIWFHFVAINNCKTLNNTYTSWDASLFNVLVLLLLSVHIYCIIARILFLIIILFLILLAAGTVEDAIREILGMTHHNSTPSLYTDSECSNFLLKVCGRDEYMEG